MNIQIIGDVKTPERGPYGSAGIDFFVPNDFKRKQLLPGENILIPSGVKVEVPAGFALIAFNKSGVALKKGLTLGACVVDHGYTGEVFINLFNHSDIISEVIAGEKIIQFVLIPVSLANVNVVDKIEIITERGEGGFGSTN